MSDQEPEVTAEGFDEKIIEAITGLGARQCLICGESARHGLPVIDQPSSDKRQWNRWLRKLYNAPPRWTIVIRGPKSFCDLHFSLAEQMADDEIADRRHSQARLNASEFSKVHVFNRGLIQSMKRVDDSIVDQIEGPR